MQIVYELTKQEEGFIRLLIEKNIEYKPIPDIDIPKEYAAELKTLKKIGYIDEEQASGHLEYGHNYRLTVAGENFIKQICQVV